MTNLVIQEVADSGKRKNHEADGARQAHYIKWCACRGIKDPVGPQGGWQLLVACWLKFAMLGINYKNKGTLRSKTSREYAEAVAELFALRGFPSPVNFDDPLNSITILVANQKKEEDVANQRRPLTLLIYAQLQKMAEEAGQDSLEACVFNIVSIGKTVGPRACEFAQKTQTKVEAH